MPSVYPVSVRPGKKDLAKNLFRAAIDLDDHLPKCGNETQKEFPKA